MGARRYSPHLAGFTSLDTYAGRAHDPASLNRYLYAHANPATLIDPTGHVVVGGGGGSSKKSTVPPLSWTSPTSGDPPSSTSGSSGGGGGGGGGTTSTGTNQTAGGGTSPLDLFSHALGYAGAVIGGAGAATWEAGTGLVGGVVDLAWCTVPLRDQGCALGELTGAHR